MSAAACLLPAPPPEEPAPVPAGGAGPLWLCCHLPDLPLEVTAGADGVPAAACAVVAEECGQPCILVGNAAARDLGILPGTGLNAALVLCPELQLPARDPLRERAALARLAEACFEFTPWVSLDHPFTLALEVRASLQLFGGLERLREAVRRRLREAGHHGRLAAAPSLFAAWLLAAHGLERPVMERAQLRSVLGALPVSALPLAARIQTQLGRAGLRNLRDLWRLPREGLRQRYGRDLVQMLDRAAGRGAEPARAYPSPLRFEAEQELPMETARLDHYWPAVERLAERMLAFLEDGDRALVRCTLLLRHRAVPATPVALELRRASRARRHVLGLLREKLERSPVPAPVCSIALKTEHIRVLVPEIADLFGARQGGDGDWQGLLDTLSVRLGAGALRRFGMNADHRPEHAQAEAAAAAVPPPANPDAVEIGNPTQEPAAESRTLLPSPPGRRWPEGPDEGERPAGSGAQFAGHGAGRSLPLGEGRVRVEAPDVPKSPPQARAAQALTPTGFGRLASLSPRGEGLTSIPLPASPRPLWLLPRPRPARLAGLRLEPGVERIESGWWDGQPVRRDYRTASDAQGRRWWLYHDLARPGSWYLQGLFG